MITTALVTGAAGFIGSHLVDRLLAAGAAVTGLDNFDPFYPPARKRANLAAALAHPRFTLVEADILHPPSLPGPFDVVFHLAARPGVRPSIADPHAFYATNLSGTQNVIDLARRLAIPHIVFASSSSVYGINPVTPWREDAALRPISPYAVSKVAAEALGHAAAHLHGLRFTALRLFSVYGPRQRPDLAIHKFARLILAGQPVPVFGDGSARRDYTYVDDIVDGLLAAAAYPGGLFEVFNLGTHRMVSTNELLAALERCLGRPAIRQTLPPHPGDVPDTFADLTRAREHLRYTAAKPLDEGLRRFAAWLAANPAI